MRMNDFEMVIDRKGEAIHVGVIIGTSKVLFIKTGQGATIYGYENKYLKLAQRMNCKYGCTVFVSATVEDTRDAYDKDVRIITEVMGNVPFEIFYMGISKGGLIGCWYGASDPNVKRILSINAPLMVNFQNRTLPAIKKLSADRLIMVYGTLDPSYRYTGFIKRYANVEILEGADHQLRGYTSVLETFVAKLFANE